jgi:hypothetical protein
VVGLRTAISFDDKKGKQQKEKIMKWWLIIKMYCFSFVFFRFHKKCWN